MKSKKSKKKLNLGKVNAKKMEDFDLDFGKQEDSSDEDGFENFGSK